MKKTNSLTPSIEDYLETIYILEQKQAGVRSIDVAAQLMVSKPSVNKALRYLISTGLAEQEKYSLIYLTPEGRTKAKEVMNRHETLKEFLFDLLGVPEERAEEEACRMEHVMSNDTVRLVRNFLNEQKVKKQ